MERHLLELTRFNRQKAHAWIDAAIMKAASGLPWFMEVREPTRTDLQNKALHGLIGQIMKQRTHHNGIRMDMRKWKGVFMQALGEEVEFIPTLDGTSVFPLGLSTSALSKAKFVALIELILCWTAQEGLIIHHFDDGDRAAAGDNLAADVAA